jgi:hypothetical protein
MYLYKKEMYNDFKFPFDGLENIEQSYSQALQDMWVLSVLNGKKNGTFLEIGAYNPVFISNTFLLERYFGWSGVSIDYDSSVEPQFKNVGRTAKFITADATKLDYDEILSEFPSNRLSYMQIDVEPNIQSLNCLKTIPFDKYKFSTITFEHDAYNKEYPKEYNDTIRKESEEILESYGYIAIAKNIENLGGDEFESWWLFKEDFDEETINKFKLPDVDIPIRARDYMLRNVNA